MDECLTPQSIKLFEDAPEQADYWKERIRGNAQSSFTCITRGDWEPEELILNMFTGPHLDYFEDFVRKGRIHSRGYTYGMKPKLRKRCLAEIAKIRESCQLAVKSVD